MARIREVRVAKQADVDGELARRGRAQLVLDAVNGSERHAPFAKEGGRLPMQPAPGHASACMPCIDHWRSLCFLVEA